MSLMIFFFQTKYKYVGVFVKGKNKQWNQLSLTFMRTNEFKASIVFGSNIGNAYLDFWEQFPFLMLRAISVHFELLNAQMQLSMNVLTFAESMLSA